MTGRSPSSRSWLVAVAALFVVNGAVAGTWLSRLPDLRTGAGLDLAGLALVLVVQRVGSMGGGLAAGLVVPRLTSRRAAVLFAVANAAALVVLPVLPGLGLGIGLAVLASTDALADIAMNLQGSAWERAGSRTVLQRLHAGWSLGLLGASGLGALLAGAGVGVGVHLAGVAVVAVAVAVATWSRLAEEEPAPPAPTARRRWGRSAVLLAVLGAATATVEVIPTEWLTIAFTEDLGTSAATAAAALAVFAASMLASRAVGDWLTDRWGTTRSWERAAALTFVGVTLVAVADAPAPRLVAVAVLAAGVAQLFPAAYRAGATDPDVSAAAGLTAMTTGARLGLLVANLAMAPATARYGVATSIWLLVAPAAVVVLVVARSRSAPARRTDDRYR